MDTELFYSDLQKTDGRGFLLDQHFKELFVFGLVVVFFVYGERVLDERHFEDHGGNWVVLDGELKIDESDHDSLFESIADNIIFFESVRDCLRIALLRCEFLNEGD